LSETNPAEELLEQLDELAMDEIQKLSKSVVSKMTSHEFSQRISRYGGNIGPATQK
jgi:hypothetical protein